MKKLVLLTLMAGALMATTAQAQTAQAAAAEPAKESAKATPASTANPGMDRASLLEKMKETFKAGMIEKTGLSAAQVDRVLELNLDMRLTASRELQGLSDADRSARLAELKADKMKKFSEFLTADQIKSVDAFYAEFAKNNPPKQSN
ncbi:hypothetical protein [Flaviaesturariibacter amylovorans]|uniref:Periplasmic heavy metal sensor n=1 Tax=Flaviaesturariibacter amylovorans TaxID=1084520 RepID=A0ABP8GJG3_9BACT